MEGLVRFVHGFVELLAGDPAGRDEVHQVVATWPGWKRSPAAGRLPGGVPCSFYRARPWSSAIVPLFDQQAIRLHFAEGVKEILRAILVDLERGKAELSPPPGHAPVLRWTDEWKRRPMPHQVQAVRAIQAFGYRALLADDMGLGKTASSIWAWQQSGVPRLLVVCPKSVKRNWRRELEATLLEVEAFVIDGTAKQRANTFGFLRHHLENATPVRRAAIINYDLLHRLPENELEVLVHWVYRAFLILDESHYAKNRKATRTQVVFDRLAPADGGAIGRLCLSGTPVRNTLEDLWAQLHIVRPGIYSSFAQFDKMHLVRGKAEYSYKREDGKARKKVKHVVRGTRDRERLNAIVNTCQVRRAKEDVLDLPPKTFTYPELELDAATEKVYRKMRDEALVELAELGDDTPIFSPGAKSAIEATLRLEQIAQGFIGGIPQRYLELVTPLIAKHAEQIPGRPGELVFPASAKIEWLQETIESIQLQGGRPLVFSRFNAPMFWLRDQWEDAELLHGGLNEGQRDDILERFMGKQISVLFCQVKLAEGWNATSSQDVIFYGRDWSPAINAQAVDRVHRIGQKGTVNVQVPIMVDTFETYLHRKLIAKQEDADVALKSITVRELREALA